MKNRFLVFFILFNLILSSKAYSQNLFCASDTYGRKYELDLIEGSGIIYAKTYSKEGTLLSSLSGKWSMQNEGVYGSAYYITANLSNGNMKFLVIRDATGNIQELQDVVAGRKFYQCDKKRIENNDNKSDDGSNYSWNQEKRGVNGSIAIGNQIWSSENLSTTTFRNGDAIPEAKTNEEWMRYLDDKKPSWCYYENKSENSTRNGKLYNYYAIQDPRGLAPAGWSIPSQDDWNKLITSLDGNSIYSMPAKYMKSRVEWAESEISSENKFSNTSGFTAYPSGYRADDGGFNGYGRFAIWWLNNGSNIGISYNNHKVNNYSFSLKSGFSVRLIENNSFSKNSELKFVNNDGQHIYEIIFLTNSENTANYKVYKDGVTIRNYSGKWKIEKQADGVDKIIFTFLEKTSGGYESSYRKVFFTYVCVYNSSKELVSVYEPNYPNEIWGKVIQ